MRAARFLWVPAVIGFLSLSPTHACADSTSVTPRDFTSVAPPDSTAVAPQDSLYRIYTEKGPWIDAARVEPWSMNTIRFVTPEGRVGYLPEHRIRTIEDEKGMDRKHEVLDKRERLGRDPTHTGSYSRQASLAERDRRGYAVVEIGYTARATGNRRWIGDDTFSTGYGWLLNISREWGVGPMLQISRSVGDADGVYHFFSSGVRARRYLGGLWTLDGTVGAFAADYDSRRTRSRFPIFGEVGVAARNAVSLFARYERHH